MTALIAALGLVAALLSGCVTPALAPARGAKTTTVSGVIEAPGTAGLGADLVVPRGAKGPLPLAVIVHGNMAHKEAFRRHAERFAAHGIAALAVQLPTHGRWIDNGRVLDAVVREIARTGRVLGQRILAERIVGVGHSFGGSALGIAAARGAPFAALVLLDPAVLMPELASYFTHVRQPTVLIGADPTVFRARQQALFWHDLAGPMLRVVVRGATHDDAQDPSMFALSAYGVDPFTSKPQRRRFAATLLEAVTRLATSPGEASLTALATRYTKGALARGLEGVERRGGRVGTPAGLAPAPMSGELDTEAGAASPPSQGEDAGDTPSGNADASRSPSPGGERGEEGYGQ